MRRWAAARTGVGWSGRAALLGALLVGLPAAAQQKPPALGAPAAPDAPPAGGKFAAPPGGAQAPQPRPPVAQAPQGGAADKFGPPPQPPPPAAAAPPPAQADKFGQPPSRGGVPPAIATPSPPGGRDGGAPGAVTPPPPASAEIPADEPPAVRRFRALLGPEARLSYQAADVIDPARGSARLRGVVLQRPDARRAEMQELTLDGLREDGVTEATARGLTLREGDSVTTVERLRIAGLSVTRPAPGQAPAPDMLSVDSLRIEGLAVQGETPVAIALVTLEDYAAGRPGRLSLEGLEVRLVGGGGPVDRVSLGRVTMRGIDLAGTLAALVARQPPPRAGGGGGGYALEAEDLVLGQGAQRVAALSTLSLTGEAPPAGQPGAETGRLALRDLRVEPFPGLDAWLRRFGYAALSADLTAEARLDRAAERLELTSLSLAGREIGALSFSLAMDGVAPEATAPEELARARLVSMALRYVDQSLYARFVRNQARETRQSEQQVRQMLAQQAAALLSGPAGGGGGPPGAKGGGGGGDPAAMAAISAAVQRFLRGEAREIEIAARPPRPVPLAELPDQAAGGPAAAQRALGLTATAR